MCRGEAALCWRFETSVAELAGLWEHGTAPATPSLNCFFNHLFNCRGKQWALPPTQSALTVSSCSLEKLSFCEALISCSARNWGGYAARCCLYSTTWGTLLTNGYDMLIHFCLCGTLLPQPRNKYHLLRRFAHLAASEFLFPYMCTHLLLIPYTIVDNVTLQCGLISKISNVAFRTSWHKRERKPFNSVAFLTHVLQMHKPGCNCELVWWSPQQSCASQRSPLGHTIHRLTERDRERWFRPYSSYF